MTAPAVAVSAIRRAAAPAPPLHAPARAFSAPSAADAWQQELPGTSVEVIVEFAGSWDLEIGGARQTVGSFAAGLVAASVRSRPVGATSLVQLAVDPLAIPAVFGVPAGELRGAAFGLDALLGAGAEQLLDDLHGRRDASERAAAGDAWVLARLAADRRDEGRRPCRDVPADVARAVALIRASGGNLRIDTLAAELGCSRRHLARRFAIWLGVTPGEYRRLVRFERATQRLQRASGMPLGELALDCGYADHAHMDREFRALAGRPPSAISAT